MLEPGQEKEVEVTYADQQNINLFSRLSQRSDGLKNEIEKLKQEDEYLNEVAEEMELMDDEDGIPYKVGDSFFRMSLEEAQEKVTKEIENLRLKIDETTAEFKDLGKQMDELKAKLYAKFGDTIHLEKD